MALKIIDKSKKVEAKISEVKNKEIPLPNKYPEDKTSNDNFNKILKMDNITLKRIESIHPKLKSELKSIYLEINESLKGKAICRFTHTLRTFSEQDSLYSKGRTTGIKGKTVTNAKGGESFHNYGLACDICLLKDTNGDGTFETASWETNVDFDGDGKADWMEVVSVFKKYGWEWGGDWKKFKDTPHFQKTLGFTIKQLLDKYNKKDFITNTKYLNL